MIDLNTDLVDLVSDEDDICNENKENDAGISLDDYIHILELKFQNAVVHDISEAYEMYCDYAHAKGFSVRKGKHEYFSGTLKIRSKLFTCSKEGSKDLENVGESFTRSNGRTGCFARVWFKCDSDGLFRVSKWVKEHNHKMAKPDERYLLRSARSISRVSGNLIESHINAGVRPTDSFNMLAEDCGGIENVGFTQKDLYNYAHLLMKSKIEPGDSQSVINHFKNKLNEEGLFYWDVQLDVEGRVANIFWRDSRARIDYELFGDVVTFDTTYRTNKYGLICAPFVGVNHHRQNVMFGCGFMSDETTTSFKWLFETFLDSMGRKQPKTFFTDQDAAMLNVAPTIFFESKHRLCQWHISQNAPSHLGSLQTQPGFMNMWKKCMNYCDSENEFEETWLRMMTDYNVVQHSWLNKMYELRHKWSTAFNTDTFYASLKSTSRSESTNHALNGMADKTTCLFKFIESFEKLVGKWRKREVELDHHSNQGVPTLSIQSSQILKQASQRYTCTIYKIFEKEYMEGVGAADIIDERECSTVVSIYEVELQSNHKVSRVLFDSSSMDIKCSCCKFETTGILCRHAFRVLTWKNMHTIPEKYFLKRWCRDVRDGVEHSSDSQSLASVSNESEMVYSNRLMRIFHEIVMQSKGHPEVRLNVHNAVSELRANVKSMLRGLNMTTNASEDVIEFNEVQRSENNDVVRDPLYVRSKGVSNKRIQRHWDKKQKRSHRAVEGITKRRKKSLTSQDASTSTPVLHDISNVMPMPPQGSRFSHTQIGANLSHDGLFKGGQPSSANNPFALESYMSGF